MPPRLLVNLLAIAVLGQAACRPSPPPQPPPAITPGPTVALEPPPTPGRPLVPATPAPRTPTLGPPGIPPGVASPTPPPPAPAGAAEARRLAESAYSGQDRRNALSLLDEAARLGEPSDRYRAYQGAWDYLREVYMQQGRPPTQKAVLDAIEAIAKTFPDYSRDQFELR